LVEPIGFQPLEENEDMSKTKSTTAKKSTKTTATKAKTEKTTKAKAQQADGKMSALDAAAKVLAEKKEPMTSKEMIEAMTAKGYWTSPGGKTPHATLYSAILRELQVKGKDARFKKTERGRFALANA